MKILIISSSAWRQDCSFGNTFSNWFEGMQNIEIANIYLDAKLPDKTEYVTNFFQISEKKVIKSVFKRHLKTWSRFSNKEIDDEAEKGDEKDISLMPFAKRNRWTIFFIIRKMLWSLGKWKSKELFDFVEEFKPDIIFQPIYHRSVANKIALMIHKKYNIPMVGFIGDDIYTLKQFSFSPLFWIDRLINRRGVRKLVNCCEMLYVASDLQKREYEKIFKLPIKTLMKFGDFTNQQYSVPNIHDPVQFVYTGNIDAGRYKALEILAKVLEEVGGGILHIYSKTELSEKQIKNLNIKEVSQFFGGISYQRVCEVQKEADVLVFAESMKLKGKLSVRQSFSTKLVDYFSVPRCIFAIGPKDIAPIEYLQENNVAVVCSNYAQMQEQIKDLLTNKEKIYYYARNAWELGIKRHQKQDMQSSLHDDLRQIITQNTTNG